MSRLRTAARHVFHRLGGVDAVRFRNRNALKALMYHRFSQRGRPLDTALELHCRHLKKHYHPVSEADVRAWLLGCEPLPQNAILVTVDDGHEDFYTVALPLFTRYEIPALVFLVSDFVDERAWLWFDKLEYLFAHTKRERLEIKIGEERATTQTGVLQALKRVPEQRKLELIAELAHFLEVDLPRHPTPAYAPLTWDQIRTASSQGTSFGGHTCTHPILTRLPGPEAIHREISDGKTRIEEKLPGCLISFAYPNGHPDDINEEAVTAVRQSGFDLAFIADTGMVARGDHPYRLCRIGMDFSMPDEYFRQQVAGFRMHRKS